LGLASLSFAYGRGGEKILSLLSCYTKGEGSIKAGEKNEELLHHEGANHLQKRRKNGTCAR